MFKQMGGVKGFLNNVKKTALFLHGGFPKLLIRWQQYCGRGGAVRRTVSIGFDVFHFKLNLKHLLQTFPPIDFLRKKTLPKAQSRQGTSSQYQYCYLDLFI